MFSISDVWNFNVSRGFYADLFRKQGILMTDKRNKMISKKNVLNIY